MTLINNSSSILGILAKSMTKRNSALNKRYYTRLPLIEHRMNLQVWPTWI